MTPSSSTRPREVPRRATLHPGRLLDLFRRAGWAARLAVGALATVAAVGVVLLLAPFPVDRPHPAPPPLTLRTGCPPAVVSAVAGAGGAANPVPSVPSWARTHDRACRDAGRSRAVTGSLLVGAGVVNAAAVLEWSRVRRRALRRRRRRRSA